MRPALLFKSGARLRGLPALRRWQAEAVLVALTCIAGTGAARAQVILPPMVPEAPPWNAVKLFDPRPFAQQWDDSDDDTVAPEDTPVKTRQQPGYEPVGVRNGPWMFYPSVMAGAVYDSNVFASNTEKRSDIAAVVHPSLRVESLWERHAAMLQADVSSYFYKNNPGLNYTNASLKGRGRYDIAHDAQLLMSFRGGHFNEEVGNVSSPAGAIQPTPYDLWSGDVTYRKEFNRLIGSVGVSFTSYDFGSTRAQNGTIINQDSRDGNIYTVHGRLEYVVSPNFGLFTALEGNARDLRGTPTQALSSSGIRALTGVDMKLTNLVRGEFGIGYARQSFDSATIGTIEGPAYRAQLTWSPTRMLDVRFNAEQIVTEASDTSATGVRADALQVALDYEFRRNVVLSLGYTYELDKFFGQDRHDTVSSTTAELKYLLNRHSSIGLRHRYISRESSLPSFTYDKHELGINVTAQY
jgi:hypothetical protein